MNLLTLPKISIIFPNYNGGKEPIDCIKSITKLNYPKNRLEVIVVDNGSNDGSKKEIENKFPKVRLIKNKLNVGFAKAVNQAIKASSGNYIFITNDDVTFEKNSLKNLIDYSIKNPNVGISGGLVYKKSPKNQISAAGNNLNRLTGNVYSCPDPQKIKQPDWIQGCAMLVKRNVVEKIGLLDDLFTYSFEDSDFCLRAKRAGFKVIYLPSAIFYHSVSTTANKNRKLTHYQWYQSKLRFALKNLPILNIISIFIFQTAFIPFEAIVKRDHRIIPYSKAITWNITNLKTTLKARKQIQKWSI